MCRAKINTIFSVLINASTCHYKYTFFVQQFDTGNLKIVDPFRFFSIT